MARRELIAPKGDTRYVRRHERERFTECDDVGHSLARDVRQQAGTKAESGQGDRGDRKGQ